MSTLNLHTQTVFLLFFTFMLFACSSPDAPGTPTPPSAAPTETIQAAPSATHTPEPTSDAITPDFEFNFDDRSDLSAFWMMAAFREDGSEFDVNADDAQLENSAFYYGLDTQVLRGANLDIPIAYDTALHLRWQAVTENTCYDFPLRGVMPNMSNEESIGGAGFGTCVGENFWISFNDLPASLANNAQEYGRLVSHADQWYEAILWASGPENPTVHYMVWDVEQPENFYVELEIQRQLTEPLTIMIYSPSYDIFVFRKAEKEILPGGWYQTFIMQDKKSFRPARISSTSGQGTNLSKHSHSTPQGGMKAIREADHEDTHLFNFVERLAPGGVFRPNAGGTNPNGSPAQRDRGKPHADSHPCASEFPPYGHTDIVPNRHTHPDVRSAGSHGRPNG